MAILGNADLAIQELPGTNPVGQSLKDIVSASRKASELSDQMLEYSGQKAMLKIPVDVNRMIEETGHMLGVTVSKKATLHYRLGDGLPVVIADPTQLRQVIMNLMLNASEVLDDAG